MRSGRTIVNSTGYRVQLDAAGDTPFASIAIFALHSNTSIVFVGDSGATAALGSENGYPLEAGIGVIIERNARTMDIWIDARVSGEGVTWWAIE